MKKTVRKIFFVWEYEKEELWLNEMSKQGWQLFKASVCKYQFEFGNPGEYEYRLEILDKSPKTMESTSYLDFLNETGIEMVGKCKNWIYLRCKTSDGGFEPNNRALYTFTHLLKIQDIFNQIRNRLVTLIVLSLVGLIILDRMDTTHIIDFLRGFCTGIAISASLISLAFTPFFKSMGKKIKAAVKELYTRE